MRSVCPQEYDGADMRVVPCTRCSIGWNQGMQKCVAPMGIEHLPLETEIPDCPIQDRCQHQVQRGAEPCPVRARGMICESALVESGMDPSEAFNHPLAFNVDTVATPEEWAETLVGMEAGHDPDRT